MVILIYYLYSTTLNEYYVKLQENTQFLKLTEHLLFQIIHIISMHLSLYIPIQGEYDY